MREELKQREAELQKSSEDKQQLKTQVQNLKEGLQKLQSAQATQVSVRTARHSEHRCGRQRLATKLIRGFPFCRSENPATFMFPSVFYFFITKQILTHTVSQGSVYDGK